jgi:hypothetical protein
MAARVTVALHRDTHLFAARPGLAEKLEKNRERILLAPDQLLHAEPDVAYLVRLGRLRVSQFLADGREITRAVLQAGALFLTAADEKTSPDPEADVYELAHIVLMALGEVELWALPPDHPDLPT